MQVRGEKGVAWAFFGDGGTSTEVDPVHTYSTDGDYTVTLTVTDDSGTSSAADTASTEVVVNRRPIADAGPDLVCAPGEVVVLDGGGSSDLDGRIAASTWTLDDGTTLDGLVAEHT